MPAAHDPKKVLLLEDDPELSLATRMLLSTIGFSTRTEKSAEDARVSLDHGFPEVLITDIGLEGEDGLSFLMWAKKQARKANRKLHAIVISGQPDHRTGLAAIEAGADRFFKKPFDPAALVAEVVKLTDSLPIGPNLTRAFVDGVRIADAVRHASN